MTMITEHKPRVMWENNDNAEFYDNISLELMPDLAIKGGLNSGCDVDLVQDYIAKASSIIEVGAGYGRVLDKILNLGYQGNLTAIERSKQFSEYLNQKFEKLVEIINIDIKNYHPSKKFDVILWLWSGISDFSKLEQPSILKHLLTWLSDDGMLVLETLSHSIKPANAETFSDQSYIIQGSGFAVYGYIPTPQEVEAYAKQSGYKLFKYIPYETTTYRQRNLYLINK